MKIQFTNQRCHALTLVEVLAVFVCLAVLAVILLPVLERPKIHGGPYCVSNIKQVNLAFLIWAGDNNNKYPMEVSTNNGGGKEWLEAGDVAEFLRTASNELSTTRILVCPADTTNTFAKDFGKGFDNSHISYFFGAGVTKGGGSGMILDGDDNLAVNGVAAKSGVCNILTNAPVAWTQARHKHVGNLGFADGSVMEESIGGLQIALQLTGFATNRLAIP
jgi:prepilin-type processing-associated H-X9-DG protein